MEIVRLRNIKIPFPLYGVRSEDIFYTLPNLMKNTYHKTINE